MIRDKASKVDKITVLRNIDNITGESSGRSGPILKFIGFAFTPPLIFFLSGLGFIIPKWAGWGIIFPIYVIYVIRLVLLIFGEEKKKLEIYRQRKENEYMVSKDLIGILPIHEDGLIEYLNGNIAYIITGFPKKEVDYHDVAESFEKVFEQFDGYDFDIHLHASDEVNLKSMLPNLRRYKDKEVVADRINLINYSTEYKARMSGMYRFSIIVRAPKYAVRELRQLCFNFPSSVHAKCFNECRVCNRNEVYDIMNRDVTAFIDIDGMLRDQYANNREDDKNVRILGYDTYEVE